jgi:hypothetical protein
MRRPPQTLELKPSLLKHFAIITIAITGCIAIFASGENAQLIEESIAAENAKIKAQAAARAKTKVRIVNGMVIAPGTNIDRGNADLSGAGENGGSASYSDSGPAAPSNSGMNDTSRYDMPAGSNNQLAGGQEGIASAGHGPSGADPAGAQQAAAGKKPGQKAAPPRLSSREVSRIMAESRARSNGTTLR